MDGVISFCIQEFMKLNLTFWLSSDFDLFVSLFILSLSEDSYFLAVCSLIRILSVNLLAYCSSRP